MSFPRMTISFSTVGYLGYDRKIGSVYDRNAVHDRFFILRWLIFLKSMLTSVLYTVKLLYGEKNRKFLFFAIDGAQRTYQPNCFFLLRYVFGCLNTCMLNSNFWHIGVILNSRSRKGRKSKVKCSENYRKFQNLLKEPKWHENSSVGQCRSENENHECRYRI